MKRCGVVERRFVRVWMVPALRSRDLDETAKTAAKTASRDLLRCSVERAASHKSNAA
jgi:hypothetical protein